MAAHGARRGNLIYHWKHGWIPLDHFAALSKAHHSKSGAVKVMQKHGIPVHDAYKGAGHNGPPKKPEAPKHSDAEIKRGYDMHGKAIPGSAPAHVQASMSRAVVSHSGDGTLLSIDRNDAEARDAAKAAGFRWSSNIGSWYLPRNQTESTRRYKVSQLEAKLGKEHVHVNDSGHGKTTSAAEREAAMRDRAANRAERMDARAAKLAAESEARHTAARAIGDNIPFGQPILLGHHSQRRAERDAERIRSNYHKSFEAAAESKAAARSADIARNAAAGDDPLKRQRRIDKNEAEIRSIDKKLQGHELFAKTNSPRLSYLKLSEDYRAKLTAARTELADQVAHDKAQIAASGFKGVDPSAVKPGDMIQYRGRTHIVAKVNKTTFSVPTGYSWEDKVPINQATKHIPLSTQSDSAIQAAYDRATNAKVKAAFAAELKRRGLLSN